MQWLDRVFAQYSLAWLLLSALVALASGILSSWLTYRLVRRPELIATSRLQAEREYTLEARKRLYHAIGALRFQLLMACRDLAARINNYGAEHSSRYHMTLEGYFGRSTLYRLLRPIAIAELIEQQISYSDFSVDPAAIGLLRFKRAAWTALTDGDAILGHPQADWSREREHVFSGTLSKLANRLLVDDAEVSGKKRPMHFHEFEAFLETPGNLRLFSPLTEILGDFTIKDKPIFWLRLVCMADICNEYLGQVGKTIGIEKHEFDLASLLSVSEDSYTQANLAGYQSAFQALARQAYS